MDEEVCKELADINWEDNRDDEIEPSILSYNNNNVDDDCIDFSLLDIVVPQKLQVGASNAPPVLMLPTMPTNDSTHDTISCIQSNQEPISNIPPLPEQHRNTLSYKEFSNGIEHQHEPDATNHVICSPPIDVDARNHNSDDFRSRNMSLQKLEVGAFEPYWITYPSKTSISECGNVGLSNDKDSTTYDMVPGPKNNTTNLVQEPITMERKKVTHWTEDEHRLFLMGLNIYGSGKWKDIASLVESKTSTQVASHAQKYFLRQSVPAADKKRKRKSIHDITSSDSKSLPHRIEQHHLNGISPTPNIPIDQPEEMQQAHHMNVPVDGEEMTHAQQMPPLNQQNNMSRQMNESTQFDREYWWMFRI